MFSNGPPVHVIQWGLSLVSLATRRVGVPVYATFGGVEVGDGTFMMMGNCQVDASFVEDHS